MDSVPLDRVLSQPGDVTRGDYKSIFELVCWRLFKSLSPAARFAPVSSALNFSPLADPFVASPRAHSHESRNGSDVSQALMSSGGQTGQLELKDNRAALQSAH